ncbi:hypothetical protein N431DRAFT_462240 [Stipitochalara longipes BDJ]|nr:hypothetical protein N431DRAFT_462240 [Stipitochalara longipes BDJ]
MSSNVHRKPVGNSRALPYSPVGESSEQLNNNDRHRASTSPAFPPPNHSERLANDTQDQDFIELVDRAFDHASNSASSPQIYSPSDVRTSLLSNSEAPTSRNARTRSVDEGNNFRVPDHARNSNGSAYTAQSKPPRNVVQWGVPTSKQIRMIGCVLLGIFLALGHHLFFSSLNTTVVGSTSRQQWAIAFGTAFAFLVASFLGLAVSSAYTQFIWTYLRKNTLSLKGIDKIFSLTSDLTGFLSLELMKRAKLVILFAILSWCMKLASLLPPATLGVISRPHVIQNTTEVWNLDTNQQHWTIDNIYGADDNSSLLLGIPPPLLQPAPLVLSSASESAETIAILPLKPPAANSSYNLQFTGPSFQCEHATEDEMIIFNTYINAFAAETLTFPSVAAYPSVPEEVQSTKTFPDALLYSAFSISLLNYTAAASGARFDSYNNWVAGVPLHLFNQTSNQQIYIQTYRESIVCTQFSATFDIQLDFIDGIQTISQYDITLVDPIIAINFNSSEDSTFDAYYSSFVALGNMIFGNVSLLIDSTENSGGDPQLSIKYKDVNSRVLQTGLIGCSEFTNNVWDGIDETFNGNFPTSNGESPILSSPWMCRNNSLSLAIEDLANNITISMLSSPDLTSPNLTVASFTLPHNVYQYNSKNLVISYSLAIGFAIIAVGIGFWALYENGVAHSTSFSAIMAATQNPDLAVLSEGSSIGVIRKDLKETKLRFGVIEEGDHGDTSYPSPEQGSDDPKHVAFGFPQTVSRLSKGRKVY